MFSVIKYFLMNIQLLRGIELGLFSFAGVLYFTLKL
uniref:Uncharacterized protein n=1 Tax=Rhizophora mucronata TaxID=61149 RepID=A0A2P2NEA6_RHIMU